VSARCDVAVIGAGLEGLSCAVLLARGGLQVIVLERAAHAGGSAARVEFAPGFRVPGLLPDATLARRALLAPLGLEGHGLSWRAGAPALFVPDASGAGLLLRRDPASMGGEIPPEESRRHAELRASLARYAPIAAALLDDVPPDLASPGTKELVQLGQTALRLRRLGQEEMFLLLRLLPSPAWDWMHDSLGMEALRTGLVAPALVGSVLGPRAPATSALVFLREALSGGGPQGGPAALVDALVSACQELGVELSCSREARTLRIGPGGVAGVELADGELVECPCVASSLSPARTLLGLVPAGALPFSCERAAASFRTRGTTAVLRLGLSRPPQFRGRPGEPIEHAISARSLLELERAADALKYRRLPEAPWIEVFVPSWSDPTLAPAGQAAAALLCHTAPVDLEGGWTEAARSGLERRMLEAFEQLAPGAPGTIVARELLTPPDIEARFGASGGHVFDGELALDQLWLQRPALALARYATPLPGLFLCGSGSHPGGPFRCGAGTLAARSMLAQRTGALRAGRSP
jgi:phytoene dehydrogenase-like protein